MPACGRWIAANSHEELKMRRWKRFARKRTKTPRRAANWGSSLWSRVPVVEVLERRRLLDLLEEARTAGTDLDVRVLQEGRASASAEASAPAIFDWPNHSQKLSSISLLQPNLASSLR